VSSRHQAQIIPRALEAIAHLHLQGEMRSHVLKREGLKFLDSEPNMHVEYLEIVDQSTLEIVDEARDAVVLFAGEIDGVRLIDNLLLH
jgi:pantothenate synthetase